MLFLKFEKGKQAELLRMLKEKSNLTWLQIAKELQATRSMVFFYLNETCKIPKWRLEKLSRLANHELDSSTEFIQGQAYGEKAAAKPALNERLSEFLGILSGDGCLENNGYAVTVTCGKAFDTEYINEEVSPLIEELFAIKPKIFSKEGRIHCRIYSKQVWEFVSKEFGFPIGEKKGKLSIPEQIGENESFLKAFLRGLFDTDGGFHRHYRTTAQLQITSYSTEFRLQVWNALKQLGFKAGTTCENINIYGKKHIDKFFAEIGSKNPRNLNRYRIFKETGTVPSQKELSKTLF